MPNRVICLGVGGRESVRLIKFSICVPLPVSWTGSVCFMAIFGRGLYKHFNFSGTTLSNKASLFKNRSSGLCKFSHSHPQVKMQNVKSEALLAFLGALDY